MVAAVIKNLIIDSNVILLPGNQGNKFQNLKNISDHWITTPSVINEIKSKSGNDFLQTILHSITTESPDKKYIQKIVELTKKTTDYSNLSKTDLDLLALTYMYHEKYSCFIDKSSRINKSSTNKGTKGFFSGDESDLDQGWISPGNLDSKNIGDKFNESYEVTLMTADFDMQNFALKSGLNVISPDDSKIITEIKYFVTLCNFCGLEAKHPLGKQFCPNCGLKGLKQIGATIDSNGKKRLHLSKNYKLNPKSFSESLEVFKGGKHPNREKMSHGHRVAEEKVPKKARKNFSNNIWKTEFGIDGVYFQQRDLNSRAAKWSFRNKSKT